MLEFFFILSTPVLASAACFVWLAARGSRASLVASLAASMLTLAIWAWTCWGLRDGIGPGEDHSHGLIAFQGFARLVWVPALAWLAFVLASATIYRKRRIVVSAA